MTSVETTIMILMPTLNKFLSAAMTWDTSIQNNLTKLGDFQEKYLWWSSVIVKPLFLGFTVILLMTEAAVLKNWPSGLQLS